MHTTMKDSMNHLFRDRFLGHEAPVDPATWQVIEARLIAAGPPADPVNDLFRERFEAHESPVSPKVWDGISSQLGHPVASTGFGWLAAGVAGVVAVGAMVLALQGEPEKKPELVQAAPMVTEAENPTAAVEGAVAEAKSESPAVVIEASTAPAPRQGAVPVPRRDAPDEERMEASDAFQPEASNIATRGNDENPAVVEHIIQTITDQVKQEVAEETRHAPQSEPGSGVHVVEEPPTAPVVVEEGTRLLLPNTFTPNNDGINDRYEVSLVGFSSLMMRVYSIKTNQLVFATDAGEPWTGTNCEDGMYLVAVEAMTLEGRMVAEGKVVYLNRNSTN